MLDGEGEGGRIKSVNIITWPSEAGKFAGQSRLVSFPLLCP